MKYPELVEELREFLTSGNAAELDFVFDTVGLYADACREVNARLKECDQLLQSGRLTEALQAAERDPNLLDAATILDFPERALLEAKLVADKRVLPPRVDLERAAQLNAAYEKAGNLTRLLASHRLLALDRGDIIDRLQVLRRLAAAEPDNDGWQADLAEYEAAALSQIKESIAQGNGSMNESALRSTLELLQSSDWRSAVPRSLTSQLSQQLQEIEDQRKLVELSQLTSEIEAAHAANDVEALASLAQSFGNYERQFGLPQGLRLSQRITAALSWLSDEQKRLAQHRQNQGDLRSLELGIREGWKREELEPVFLRLMTSHASIPQDLVTMYRSRESGWLVHHRRRQQIIVLGIIGTLAITAATVWTLLDRSARATELSESRTYLRNLVEKEDWIAAREYLDWLQKNSPQLLDDPEIKSLAAKVKDAEETETRRRQEFERNIKHIEERGIAEPDTAALQRAEDLARTETEKAQVLEWRSRIRQYKNQRFQNRMDEFNAKLDQLSRAINAADPDKLTDAQLRQLDSRAEELRATYNDLPRNLTEPITLLRKQISTIIEQHRQTRSWDKDKLSLAQASQVSEYKGALAELVTRYPQNPVSSELSIALSRADAWAGLERLRAYFAMASQCMFDQLGPEKAREILKLREAAEKDLGTLVIQDPLANWTDYLKSASSLDSTESQKVFDGLSQLVELPIFRDAKKVIRANEQGQPSSYFYLKADQGKDLWIYFKSINGDTAKRTFNLAAQKPLENCVCDHVERIKRFLSYKDRLLLTNQGFLAILEKLNTEKNLDPVLKVALLRRFVADGSTISDLLKQRLDGVSKAIDNANLDLGANWVLPSDKIAEQARVNSEAFLNKYEPKFNEAFAAARNDLQRLSSIRIPKLPEYVGFLMRGQTMLEFQLAEGIELPANGDLVCLLPQGARYSLQKIGRIDQGTPRLLETAQKAASGDRVYVQSD